MRKRGSKQLVVCVDDEAPVLNALKRMFRHEPFELVTTSNAEEALEWVMKRDVSLLVTDQRMADTDGVELLRAVRECSPETALLMLTGYPDRDAISGRLQNGFERLITKPWNDEELKRTIRQLLDEKEMRRSEEIPG